jgi:hypothetical protein
MTGRCRITLPDATPSDSRLSLSTPRGYELLLRSYPKSWRASRRTDELLAIMLEDSEAHDRVRPTLGESFDVIWHGLCVRLRSLDVVLPADVRLAVVRLSLVISTALASFCLVFGEVRIAGFSSGTVPSDIQFPHNPAGLEFMTLGAYVYLGWAAMFGLYLTGRMRTYRYLAAATLLGTVLLPTLAGLLDRQRPPGSVLLLFGLLNVLALLPTPTIERYRPGMATAMPALLAALVMLRLYGDHAHGSVGASSRYGFYWLQYGAYGVRDLAQVITPYVVAIALVIALISGRSSWPVAVGLVAVPFVALQSIGNPAIYGHEVYGHLGSNLSRAMFETALFAVIVLTTSPRFRKHKRV